MTGIHKELRMGNGDEDGTGFSATRTKHPDALNTYTHFNFLSHIKPRVDEFKSKT